ncbi:MULTISPECIES: peroxidase-related enzyme [unclassified Chelatococcus]|uniref:peroxidase-related enzyme n=1 Tax=unclassified Chelatococcus TaxID=2638111 RepID=UPI001BCC4453|nr:MULTISPECIES: peroxidase-related enzyme [unclassified Chelatococcus]MBS7740073.1 peroxidase-related enzyme [Chelatococcus sp. HY11]MBX3545098.1 peroxidase-related enzyme [Chelatococcus sp.]MCO5078626.1 peroxidase-related enzyme [Chelatococcus sp.]
MSEPVQNSPVHEFTAEPLQWSPYLKPVRLEEATPEQLDAMKVTPSNKKVSEYVLTLAHDPESLAVRSPLFNAIMYGRDGLSRAERELGAVGASIVNRCVYCASVHAAQFNRLTERTDVIARIFADGPAAELEEHQQAIFDFAVKLSETPPAVTREDAAALRDCGLSALEMADLVLSAAIFGWANRLMHTLGEPLRPPAKPVA